jgi:AmmeMemoRadiSam system protein A
MAATPSTLLDPAARGLLLRIAAHSIETGLARAPDEPPAAATLPVELQLERASFVTLTVGHQLRGCCGTLEPRRGLACDVWHNARASAFGDPRFAPLARSEWVEAALEISVLSALERVEAGSEQSLQRRLRPGIDGLVLAWRGQRATFLPKVWEQLPDPWDFIRRLKAKAGWDADFWAADLESWRYTVETMAVQRAAGAMRWID